MRLVKVRGAGGFEMQELGSPRGRTGGDEDRERDELLAHELQQEEEREERHPLDGFYTGDYMLVRLHLVDTVRAQWRADGLRATAPMTAAARTAGMQTTAEDLVGGRFRFSWGRRID